MKNTYPVIICMLVLMACGKKDDNLVVIKTSLGDIKVVLFDETPQHKANFLKLVKEGKYDSTFFHRVVNGYVIQGGDVNAKGKAGDSVVYELKPEIQENVTGKFLHTRGAFAAPRRPDGENPERLSSGSQFYIVQGRVFEDYILGANWDILGRAAEQILYDTKYSFLLDSVREIQQDGGTNEDISRMIYRNRQIIAEGMGVDVTTKLNQEQIKAYSTVGGAYSLDNEYTVYGRVVEGMDVVDKIAQIKAIGERPTRRIYMEVELEPISKSEITEKYGIDFPQQTTEANEL